MNSDVGSVTQAVRTLKVWISIIAVIRGLAHGGKVKSCGGFTQSLNIVTFEMRTHVVCQFAPRTQTGQS